MIPRLRVWDKKNEAMLHKVRISTYIDETMVEIANQWHWVERSFPDVILMQSTGLKDKNGLEIFEGDICNVEVNMWGVIMTRTGEVIFNEDDIQYQIMIEEFLTITGKSEFETSEIIGNIYENPELLEAHT